MASLRRSARSSWKVPGLTEEMIFRYFASICRSIGTMLMNRLVP